MLNAIGHEIPDYIEGYGAVKHYSGSLKTDAAETSHGTAVRGTGAKKAKLFRSLQEAIAYVGLRSGMTVSFHHHLRNGDRVTNMVMDAISQAGLRDIKVAASGLFACHDPLAAHIENGTVTGLTLSTISRGRVADAIAAGKLGRPAVFMTHGGRARAIESGDLHIDVAFIAAPACDIRGNANGCEGPSACGMLSYAAADAQYADHVIIVTDHLLPSLRFPAEIDGNTVDGIVQADSIGDPAGIVFGPTRISADPENLAIARRAAEVLLAAGYIRDGMSFQTGAGGISLAVAGEVASLMKERGVVGSFAMGGITAPIVEMLRAGLFRELLDVQCFDSAAIASVTEDGGHRVITAAEYANPRRKSCAVDDLDVMILGATEMDVDFNVNVITGSNGAILSAAGGNSDCAAGAKIAVVVSKLVKGKFSFVRDKVTTVVTPGETVDVLVTDHGIAVNPRRTDLLEALARSGIETKPIAELKKIGEQLAGPSVSADLEDTIVGVVEYRDGSVIDVVYKTR